MKKGLITFLVLLAFIPTAMHVTLTNTKHTEKITNTKQLMLEQQAITIKEQDFEETLERTMQNNADLKTWEQEMQKKGIKPWYGNTHGDLKQVLENPPTTFEPKTNNYYSNTGEKVSIAGDEYDAIGATITIGNSKGIYLIPMGCSYEHN